jgi:rare lipoprotein A
MKQRWLIVVGLLVVCQVGLSQVDLAVAASRSPSLLQRILSVFTPRPVRHVHATATDHAGVQKIESPRVKTVRAAQPLDMPIEAPTPLGAAQFAETARAGQLVPPVEAAPAITPPAAPASKKAKRSSDMQAAQPKKAAQPLPAAPPREAAQTIQKPQPPPAEPPIETVGAVPAAQPEPASRPLQTAQMYKAANKVRSVKTTQSLQPVQPAQVAQPMQLQSMQVAILGAPNLKAALPDEGVAPVEQPRSNDGPAKPASRSACNGGRRMVSAYYWEGRHTASGQAFNPHAMTAAHRTLPFGTHLDVTNPRTGKTVNVLINDRGPFVRGVSLDLSLGAAQAIGLHGTGSVCIL